MGIDERRDDGLGPHVDPDRIRRRVDFAALSDREDTGAPYEQVPRFQEVPVPDDEPRALEQDFLSPACVMRGTGGLPRAAGRERSQAEEDRQHPAGAGSSRSAQAACAKRPGAVMKLRHSGL